ncbi:hypothetical protein, partial [Moraxella sp. 7664RN]|uniref:hypothetical protein n=1 Tax=Moraxella sp. 7664RN TaxID=3110541 RepID=UPI002B407264
IFRLIFKSQKVAFIELYQSSYHKATTPQRFTHGNECPVSSFSYISLTSSRNDEKLTGRKWTSPPFETPLKLFEFSAINGGFKIF